jgi:asparagine synthetase B (glutamine-hydrolysing)
MGLKTTLSISPRDQAIMANSNGINMEYPFLDRNILEYCLGIPGKIKLRRFTAKYIFKKAAGQNLPKEIFRRKKSGLPVPLASWLKDAAGMGRYLEMLKDETTKKKRPFQYQTIK